jgi:hypothetical protein
MIVNDELQTTALMQCPNSMQYLAFAIPFRCILS